MNKKSWKLDDDMRADIVRLVTMQGVSATEVAARKGVSTVTIWRVVKKLYPEGVKTRRTPDATLLTDDSWCLAIFQVREATAPRPSWKTLHNGTKLSMPFLRKAYQIGAAIAADKDRAAKATDVEAKKEEILKQCSSL